MESIKNIQTKKIKMTQIWDGDCVVPVTVLACDLAEGETIDLEKNVLVDATGTSKGKGFQGVVKRHGFHGGPKTHGQKNRHRAPGSIGATAPQRVIKGKKMAGHMGNVRVTIKNLRVASIDLDQKIVMLEGAVPGNRGSKIVIRKK